MKQQAKPLHDWHPADIKAALEKRGTSLAAIGRELGYAATSPYDVLRRRWIAMEQAVGAKLGVHPATIWPSRYDTGTGLPLRARAA